MPIPEKELREYIDRRHVGDRFTPIAPTGRPGPHTGPVMGRKITGPQLTAARPVLERLGDNALRKKIEAHLFTWPLFNVLEMITNPNNDEFAACKPQMLELAEAIVAPEYKRDTPPSSP
jgi:hypothetical protein